MSDRKVHAFAENGSEVVRYDRAGKWWVEHPAGSLLPARQVSMREAARIAIEFWYERGGSVNFGVPGGSAFDREIRKPKAQR